MYLSQLQLNASNQATAKLLANRYRLHAAVMRGFTETSNDERILFRVEPTAGRSTWQEILIQSQAEPDWTPLLSDYAPACQIRTKRFSIQPRTDQHYRFRLLANPTVTRNRKRLGLVGETAQREWLATRAQERGFRLVDCTVIDEGLLPAWKKEDDNRTGKGKRLTIRAVRYEGRIQLTAPALFTRALTHGIGPAKGLGCGLLSLAPG